MNVIVENVVNYFNTGTKYYLDSESAATGEIKGFMSADHENSVSSTNSQQKSYCTSKTSDENLLSLRG